MVSRRIFRRISGHQGKKKSFHNYEIMGTRKTNRVVPLNEEALPKIIEKKLGGSILGSTKAGKGGGRTISLIRTTTRGDKKLEREPEEVGRGEKYLQAQCLG